MCTVSPTIWFCQGLLAAWLTHSASRLFPLSEKYPSKVLCSCLLQADYGEMMLLEEAPAPDVSFCCWDLKEKEQSPG